ncbi:hypothetical protein EJ357_24570 [Streptomyces cyaneochromogenes]|uniref:Uncharacterized protein n=1 Tax=Streptomyces cyaneochromogenes TaxID=2496836 RepID=A0A3Q9EPI4_9ACTN|nr:DUF6082 family protein [Streptomyces cyaneochromogenes]AZQ36246.1 hypothetical protein EJ357_24570 [Streptomyces cyaneochromogenes]
MVAAAAAVLAALLLSPFVLEDVSGSKGVDWNRLSQVGAAYGFTSAIVSALALAGIAASLVVQNRQARAEQVQGIRSYYLELVRLELDDMALYQPVWGATDIADPHERKRHVYADLMMNGCGTPGVCTLCGWRGRGRGLRWSTKDTGEGGGLPASLPRAPLFGLLPLVCPARRRAPPPRP